MGVGAYRHQGGRLRVARGWAGRPARCPLSASDICGRRASSTGSPSSPCPAPDLDRVYQLSPMLAQRRRQAAGTLSGGEQQMLAIGGSLMARRRIMLLDEPSMGLAPVIVQEVFRALPRLEGEGITILLVEQFARAALEIADDAYVMERGRIVIEGTPEVLGRDEGMLAAHWGWPTCLGARARQIRSSASTSARASSSSCVEEPPPRRITSAGPRPSWPRSACRTSPGRRARNGGATGCRRDPGPIHWPKPHGHWKSIPAAC
jgi:branched-chain amino acid transport system ATP-binding protein